MSRQNESSNSQRRTSVPGNARDQYNIHYGFTDNDVSPNTGCHPASPYYGQRLPGMGSGSDIRAGGSNPPIGRTTSAAPILSRSLYLVDGDDQVHIPWGPAAQRPFNVIDPRLSHHNVPAQHDVQSSVPGHIRSRNPLFDNFGTWAPPQDMQNVHTAASQTHNQQTHPAPFLPVEDPPINERLAMSRAPAAPMRQSAQNRLSGECVCPLGCIATRHTKRNTPGQPLTFGRQDVMHRHLRSKHGQDVLAEFHCLLCDDERGHDARRDLVSRHCEREHPGKWAFGCHHCFYRTLHQTELQDHLQEHPEHAAQCASQSNRVPPYQRVSRESASASSFSSASSPSSGLQVPRSQTRGPSATLDPDYLRVLTVPTASRSRSSTTQSWELSFPNSSPPVSGAVHRSMFAPPPGSQTPASSPPGSFPVPSSGLEAYGFGENGDSAHPRGAGLNAWTLQEAHETPFARSEGRDDEEGFDAGEYISESYD